MIKSTDQAVLEPGAPGKDKKISTTVVYTGKGPFMDEFAPEVPIGTIKRKAMHQFEIEPSAADEYALQYADANLDDKTKIGELGRGPLTLTLVRVKPQEKGVWPTR